MMLRYTYLCRPEGIFLCNDIRKLFPSVFTEFPYKLFICHVMVNSFRRKILHIGIAFSFGLFLFWNCQLLRFFCIKITHRLCFIEEYDISVYFHEAYLIRIIHFFRRTPKTMLSCCYELLKHLLGLFMLDTVFFSHLFHLFLHLHKQCDKYRLVHCIQLFFGELYCHDRDLSFRHDYNRKPYFRRLTALLPLVIMTVDNRPGISEDRNFLYFNS